MTENSVKLQLAFLCGFISTDNLKEMPLDDMADWFMTEPQADVCREILRTLSEMDSWLANFTFLYQRSASYPNSFEKVISAFKRKLEGQKTEFLEKMIAPKTDPGIKEMVIQVLAQRKDIRTEKLIELFREPGNDFNRRLLVEEIKNRPDARQCLDLPEPPENLEEKQPIFMHPRPTFD